MENLFSLFSQEFQYAMGWTVLHSLWQATLIAILSGVVMIVLRKKTAQTRYIVHNFALYGVLLAAMVTFSFYYNSNKTTKQAEPIAKIATPAPAPKPTTKFSFETPESLKITIEAGDLQPIVAEKEATPAPLSIEGMKAYFDANIYFVVMVWLLGVGLFILKLLGGISYVYYLRNQHNFPVDEYWFEMVEDLSKRVNIQKNIALVESALVRSPVVVGYLKPMILFPIGAINRLNAEEVEAILAHEIAHVMRHDYVFNIIQSVIEALFYFNPAVWWISANIRAERENCCDDVAIQLCGNSMAYAKSLVVVQEMQYYSAAFAMGFAGQRKNQLLLRVQRVLNQSNNKTNVMEKLIATCLIVIGMVFISYGGPKELLPNLFDKTNFFESNDATLSMNGYWNATIKGDEVEVSFQTKTATSNWNSTHTFKKSEFSALPTSESDFTLTREAGTMAFKGKFEGNEGYGKYTFSENTDFKTYLEKEGIEGVKESMMVHLFMSNINRDYIAFLKQNGYKDITKSNLQDLAIHGLTKEVLTSYFATFNKQDLSLNKVVELKIHGVDAKYKKDLNDAGYIDVPTDQIVEAKIHGINGDYLKDLATSGYKNPSLQDVIEFKIHGVNGAFIKKMQAATERELSHNDIVEAKIHGIDANFVNSYKDMGFKNLNIQKAIEFKIHGVTADFVANLNKMGYEDMSASKVVELKIHGADAAFVKGFEDIGYKDMPINKLVEYKIHGVTPAMVQGFEKIGYKDISPNKLVEMKIHGVTGDFIKGFQDIGFKNVDLSDAVALKIHGVTPQYIQDMKAKGYKDLDLDEYINLKIRGFNK